MTTDQSKIPPCRFRFFCFETKTGCGVKANSGEKVTGFFLGVFYTGFTPYIYRYIFLAEKRRNSPNRGVGACGAYPGVYMIRVLGAICLWTDVALTVDIGRDYGYVAVERHYLKDFLEMRRVSDTAEALLKWYRLSLHVAKEPYVNTDAA